MDNPLVSIIVRTKDRPKLLKRALQSIAAQTYRPIEVVLVNDGGCDLDVEEIKGILGDVSLNYVRLEKNTGRAHAGNIGIENSKGKYIGFLDDDDEFYPEHVETLTSFLEQSDIKIAYTDSVMVYEEYGDRAGQDTNLKKELVYSRDFDYDTLIFENYIPFMCLLFDRGVFAELGGLDIDFEVYEDYDLLIRLGEKYPFYHVRKITADYHQWCSSSQIAQKNEDLNFLRDSYLRLFSKHIDKFTPERIYNYASYKYSSLAERDARIRDLGILVKDKDVYIENLIKDNNRHMRNLHDVIRGKDQYIASLIGQLHQKDQDMTDLAGRLEGLESTVREKDVLLNTIFASRGWKVLSLYYRARDSLLPVGSFRRRLVKGVVKSMLLLPKCLSKKKARPDSRFIYQVETDLSRSFVIGEGNALYLRGWCYHTSAKIKKLSVFVEDKEHRVSNFSFSREDVFEEQYGRCDFEGYSLNSGFWTVIPFSKVNSEYRASLTLQAELDGGKVCRAPIGTLQLVPSFARRDYESRMTFMSDEPLIAICMAAYNPSIEYFKRQIDSIVNQEHKNWICIINDDCSQHEIFEKMEEIISADPRFTIYKNPANLGFYHNFEKCLSYVPPTASFVALCDQDDYWHEEKLSSLLSLFDDDTTLVYSDMNIVDEKGEIIHDSYWTTRKNNYTELDLLMLANTVTGASSLFRSDLLDLLLPFPAKIADSFHDHFIACIALSLGKIKYVNRPLYDYYQHGDNIIGHCAPKKKDVGTEAVNRGRIGVRGVRDFAASMGDRLASYRKVYFDHYVRRVFIAKIIDLRCPNVSAEKRKILKRFARLEYSLYGMVVQVLKDSLYSKNAITIGIDRLLLKSALSTKVVNLYGRIGRAFRVM